MIDSLRFSLYMGLGLAAFVTLQAISSWCRARARNALFRSLSWPGVAAKVIDKLAALRDFQVEPSDDPRAQTGLYCLRRGVVLVSPKYITATSARVLALLAHEMQHGRQHRAIGRAFWLFDLPQWLQIAALLAIAAAGILQGAVAAWGLWAVMVALYLGRFGFEINANSVALGEIGACGGSAEDLREARAQLNLGAASYAFGYMAFVICMGFIAWEAALFH
jgi:Zn-dependent membrane protease YugP